MQGGGVRAPLQHKHKHDNELDNEACAKCDDCCRDQHKHDNELEHDYHEHNIHHK